MDNCIWTALDSRKEPLESAIQKAAARVFGSTLNGFASRKKHSKFLVCGTWGTESECVFKSCQDSSA